MGHKVRYMFWALSQWGITQVHVLGPQPMGDKAGTCWAPDSRCTELEDAACFEGGPGILSPIAHRSNCTNTP